jgi:hypothetical protein
MQNSRNLWPVTVSSRMIVESHARNRPCLDHDRQQTILTGLRRRVYHPPVHSSNLGTDSSLDSEGISPFSGQPDVIAYVATVQPKPGIFIDEISYLLVLCTPTSVLLIGVSVSPVIGQDGKAHEEIRMYATDMSVSTDVEMTSVVGTADGRMFMCGSQDGCLYELRYQEKGGWSGKRVHVINHSIGGVQTLLLKLMGKSDGAQVLMTYFGRVDPRIDRVTSVVVDKKRHVLYTLSSSSAISVYRTSGDKAVQHLQTLSNVYITMWTAAERIASAARRHMDSKIHLNGRCGFLHH